MGIAIDAEYHEELKRQLAEAEEDGNLMTEKINRLQLVLRMPLTSAELKLVDKHCDWVSFGHAWNSVMKSRIARLDGEAS